MFRPIFRALLTFIVIVLAAACGDDTPSTPNQPTPPTMTDTFTGTLNRNGAMTHQFSASASGLVTATLTSLTPDSTLRIGVALGTWNGNQCQIIVAKDNATQGEQIIGQITTVGGTFCIRIADNGNLTEPTSYAVSVLHP